jgi:hypothetical protein
MPHGHSRIPRVSHWLCRCNGCPQGIPREAGGRLTTTYERLRDALESHGGTVKETGGNKLVAQCPAHNDRNPSLSVTGIEGSALLHCHAGCQSEDVLAAVGLTKADLFDNRRDTTYTYPGGRKVHRKPDKDFPQSGNKADRSLFHGDRIHAATHVLVVEGEKDVLAAEAAGMAAVCPAMGAGKASKADWAPIERKHVLVVADNDEPGLKHAAEVAELVTAAGAASVKMARAAVGKDLADHIAAGKTIKELIEVEPATEPTTWEAINLGPYLAGEVTSPQPEVGISRSDGQKLIYAGREHTIFGETEGGKSWFALECAAVEIRMGRDVVYIHYEEGDPGSTIERLLLLGCHPDQIARHLRFVAPARPARGEWLTALLDPPPVLVIHDGVNEAMSLHGDDSMATDGAAAFRRNIIKPCLRAGAATLSCDHVVKNSDNRGRYAIGSGHKVNAIDGAAFLVENMEPFGRGLRGASSVYVTKDRPGQLRTHGKPTGIPGKTFIGVLVVDSTGDSSDFLTFWAPKDDGYAQGDDTKKAVWSLAEIGNMLYGIVADEPDHTVKSRRDLFAKMRDAGNMFRDDAMRQAADVLVVSGRLTEVPGKRGATGYRAVLTASQPSNQETPDATASATASHTASPIDGDAVGRSRSRSASDCSGRSGTQWDAVEDSSSDSELRTPICGHCDKELLSPTSRGRGHCEACDINVRRGDDAEASQPGARASR